MPDQVLDMILPTFRACIEGYQDHLFDLKCIAVYQGFWAGYYGNSKRPKPLTTVLNTLNKEHLKAKKKQQSSSSVSKPSAEVDVDKFLAMERKRLKVKPKQ